MTVKDTIDAFRDKLRGHLHFHDGFLDQWDDTDWHERRVLIDKMLHEMWSIYEDAEDMAVVLKETFPPYPFVEIKEIRKWLREAISRMDNFLDEDYQGEDVEEYLSAYQSFLSKVCSDDVKKGSWYQREQHIAANERVLLDMLNQSYSVLLELLLSCHKSMQSDDTTIILAYENRKARYEQLCWKRDREAFHRTLESMFPWDNPTRMQLLDFYQNKLSEMKQTRIGKAYIENPEDDFVLEIAKLDLSEEELVTFFRTKKELEELTVMAKSLEEPNNGQEEEVKKQQEVRKKGPAFHYLFVGTKPAIDDVAVKNREKERFMQYIKAHKLSSRMLNCNKKDKVNEILICFLLQW